MRLIDAVIVSLLLCCQMQAQSTSPTAKTSAKPKSQVSKAVPEAKAPDISKEFMPLARKAFQSLDNLNEHFWEDYDKDAAWTPRQMAAETARDDLKAVANTSVEKAISFQVEYYLSALTHYRTILNISASLGSLTEARRRHIHSELEDVFTSPCYAESKKLAITGVPETDRKCGSKTPTPQ